MTITTSFSFNLFQLMLSLQPNNSWQTLECLYVVHQFRSFHVYITHAIDKHMDKLAKSEIIIVFMNYSPFVLHIDDIYSAVRN